jgi:hypothetical protein
MYTSSFSLLFARFQYAGPDGVALQQAVDIYLYMRMYMYIIILTLVHSFPVRGARPCRLAAGRRHSSVHMCAYVHHDSDSCSFFFFLVRGAGLGRFAAGRGRTKSHEAAWNTCDSRDTPVYIGLLRCVDACRKA